MDTTGKNILNDTISLIVDTIKQSGFRSVHYLGAADEGLLRALLNVKPGLEISVMDMPDRWERSYAFWYDEREFGDCLPRDRPEWLEGVSFYQEGAPDHDVLSTKGTAHEQLPKLDYD